MHSEAALPERTRGATPVDPLPSLLGSRQAFLIVDEAGRIAFASEDTHAILAVDKAAKLCGMHLLDIFAAASANDEESFPALQSFLQENSLSQRAVILRGRTGDADQPRSLQLSITSFNDQYRVVTIGDTTLAAEREASLLAAAHRDALTGIGNRALFEKTLDSIMSSIDQGGLEGAFILFLDLDRFKIVNDTLGHAAGDHLLRLVSERLRSALRPSDTLARMGGDEFAILLDAPVDKDGAAKLATRIIDLIQRTYLIEGQVVNVGASIGIAAAPEDAISSDQLLKNADLALYCSKASGRGVYHFYESSMRERAERRRTMELELRKALVLRQFELHYQPQIDARSREVTGLEALLRWRHPQRGLLLPADFIGLAEEIGLSVPLGEWVIRTACREAARWPQAGTVAINVSPLQFQSKTFLESVRKAIENAALPGSRLEVEVTEEIMQRSGKGLLSTLEGLQALGVHVVISGFGTGLASLSQLVNFSFDKIKIDRTLIALQQVDEVRSRAIVRAISALGQSLGISTLAEGVETPEHLAKVQAEGCHLVQGFYYSKAVPASELAVFFNGTYSTVVSTSMMGERAYESRAL